MKYKILAEIALSTFNSTHYIYSEMENRLHDQSDDELPNF